MWVGLGEAGWGVGAGVCVEQSHLCICVSFSFFYQNEHVWVCLCKWLGWWGGRLIDYWIGWDLRLDRLVVTCVGWSKV